MRITFLFPTPNHSGGCRVVALYAEGLALRGHDVCIASTSPAKISFISKVKRLVRNREWLKNKTEKELIENSHFANVRGVDVRLLNHSGPIQNDDIPDAEVVIATWWETAEWIMNLNRNKGKKYYFIQGYEAFPYLPVERVKATYRLPIKKITIAQWLVDVMRTNYGDSNVSLVPNSVDKKLFYAEKRDKQKIPTFGLMYSQEEFKGTGISLAAFEYAKTKYPQIKLLVFGASRPNKKVPLPKESSFFLSLPQDKIRDIYSQCDGFLFSSKSEGFGLPVLEAMACRCPVIATKAGCAPDFIVRGVNGELNEIDDIVAQGESIIKIIEMKNSAWKAMSEAAHEAITKSSWDDSIDTFEKSLLK